MPAKLRKAATLLAAGGGHTCSLWRDAADQYWFAPHRDEPRNLAPANPRWFPIVARLEGDYIIVPTTNCSRRVQ